MKDSQGEILYIGKANNLKNRVLSYFREQSKKERYQIAFLMRKVADIEYVVTDNEKEALLLENTLIKKHKPRYNIFLKDDKSFLSLKINDPHPFPGLFITRHVVKDGSSYFGPYTSAHALRETVDLLTRTFKLRTCSDREFANRSRPCLKFDIGRCSGPCVGKINSKTYASHADIVRLFLSGKKKEFIEILKERMKQASEERRYEEAAGDRDMVRHIEETLEGQKVIRYEGGDFDVVALARGEKSVAIAVLLFRRGTLVDQKRFLFLRAVGEKKDLLEQFVLQYYGPHLEIPPKIFVSEKVDVVLKGVRFLSPVRGEGAKMIALAEKNAKEYVSAKKGMDVEELLETLQSKLNLATFPRVIECVDISNIQGKEAVGSLVAFADGEPDKNRYRKFKIQMPEEPNDYGMMYEVLSRRFTHGEDPKWVWPDLLMVDGGKGQLQIALKVLADLGIHQLPVIAIAKEKTKRFSDKIYLPGRKNPAPIKPKSNELLYLMRIRDEAHRFGIAYHRKLRSKKFLPAG